MIAFMLVSVLLAAASCSGSETSSVPGATSSALMSGDSIASVSPSSSLLSIDKFPKGWAYLSNNFGNGALLGYPSNSLAYGTTGNPPISRITIHSSVFPTIVDAQNRYALQNTQGSQTMDVGEQSLLFAGSSHDFLLFRRNNVLVGLMSDYPSSNTKDMVALIKKLAAEMDKHIIYSVTTGKEPSDKPTDMKAYVPETEMQKPPTPITLPSGTYMYTQFGMQESLTVKGDTIELFNAIDGKRVFKYSISGDGKSISLTNVVTGKVVKQRFSYSTEAKAIVIGDMEYYRE